ncbi:hypothetical protein D3C73_1396320 [compost metagenome]
MGCEDSGCYSKQCDDGTDREEAAARQRNSRLGHGGIEGVVNRYGIDADDIAQAPGQEHSSQCDDERLNGEIMDNRPHNRTEYSAHQEYKRDDHGGRPALLLYQARRDHCG